MKILFDSQIFNSQKYGGISRYFSELFKHFDNVNNLTYVLPIRDTRNEYISKLPKFKTVSIRKSFFPKLNFKLQRVLSSIFDYFDKDSNINRDKKALKGQDFDVFHPTYYSTYFLKYLKNKPLVLTVHDMIHEIYPEYFLLDHGKTTKQKKLLIMRANKIIAVSENTKKDIVRFYNIPDDKIKVVYHGNSMEVSKEKIIIENIPSKYILFVGSRVIYKNFFLFIEAIAPILKKDSELNVVVAGGYSGKNGFTKEEITLFTNLGIEEQIVHYSINDKVLSGLYQNAICFAFPTLYEGFGIPVLEAFACNCPAIISNTSSLPEVGGEAVEYFDPTNKEDLRAKVEKVIYNPGLRQEMIIKGQNQLKKFSWSKTAEETLEVYSSVI